MERVGMRNKKWLMSISIVVGSVLALAGIFTTAKAISPEDLEYFAQNNSPYYEPCAEGSVLNGDISISGSTAEEKVWSGLKSFLTDEQAAGIMGNIAQEDGNYNPVRREAGQSGSLYNRGVQMGLGLVQWSFGRRVNLLEYVKSQDESMIKYFEDDSNAQITGDEFIKKVGEDVANKIYQLEIQFLKNEIDKGYKEYYNQTDVKEATVWFRAKFERAGVYSDDFRVKKAQEAYEKYAGKTISGSSGESGYSLSGVPCDANVEGSKNINGAAVALAWPLGTKNKVYDYPNGKPTEAFDNALDKVYPDRGWSHCPRIGASCDVFVGTVVRWSGYDKHFPRGLDEQIPYVKNHKNLWELISWNGDNSKLQAGDVIHVSGHTYIVVQDANGKFWTAEAGYCRVFGHLMKLRSYSSGYIIRAKKANNSTVGISVTKGVNTSSTNGVISNTSQGNHDIGTSAITLAWAENKKAESQKTATNEFTEFYNKQPDKLTSGPGKGGKSCDHFVGTVVRYSGLDDNIPLSLYDMQPYLESSADWEEVQAPDKGNKESDYQPGDVVFYYRNNGWGDRVYEGKKLAHVGIYAKGADGKGHIVAASYGDHYGIVQGFRGVSNFNPVIRIYRNKNNTNSTGECDVCAGNDEGEVGLKSGGLNMEDAKKLMDTYRGYAAANNLRGDTAVAKKYHIMVGCHGNLFLNCPSFVKYFVNRYTTKQWTTGMTGNGNTVAKKLAKDLDLETGTQPRPYAVFSDDSYSPGHTGVVLGVDKTKGTMLIGEAGCMSYASRQAAFDFVGVNERPIDKYHIYAYLDPIIKMGDI